MGYVTVPWKVHKLEVWEKLIFHAMSYSRTISPVLRLMSQVIKCLHAEQDYLSSKTTNELSKNKSSARLWDYPIIRFTVRSKWICWGFNSSPTTSLNQLEYHSFLPDPGPAELPTKSPLGVSLDVLPNYPKQYPIYKFLYHPIIHHCPIHSCSHSTPQTWRSLT